MPELIWRRQYPTDPASVALVRRDCRNFLAGWGISDADSQASAVILAVSELTTNAVTHGVSGLPFRFSVELFGDVLHAEVRDHRDALPVLRQADDQATSGRGLVLVDALSDDWGWRTEVMGKTVWAEFKVNAGAKACIE
ncbi:ATP-binding protein [Streptomyces lunaelactis]|uniref:ATP-binding protein n=1 Tax=Streptomyces lunaelactis TaxID=1535768 RepID=UPI001584A5C6|nr:ATP-binding protein [Streptomyces lunaelactis]NUK01733.1 ATP-binding protein [Streptomyces lunaelactis]NUK34576.1 ATP-binding protein [Streptomyces lunaelactis]NUK42221.1 ATP-binding protein [Streptomyces lunaelactis]NUK91656.1 ATP-binding protein [Streptomyces lunaelactis]NUL31118.1 ATP-binding protein [Streptomyces lunaelactis]